MTRDGWTESHDVRPLTELGLRQAVALVSAVGTGVDDIYSSPATRGRPTVEPLAGTQGVSEVIVRAVGGAWAAGGMLRAVTVMMAAHPAGRVVAAWG